MSDQIVSTRDVLRALLRVRREGASRLMNELEQREADLCEFVLEELTALHGLLVVAGVPPAQERRIFRRMESGALVLVLALQNASHRLCEQSIADTPLARLDPAADSSVPDDLC